MSEALPRIWTRGGMPVGDGRVWEVGFWQDDNGGAVLLTDFHLLDEETSVEITPSVGAQILGVLLPLFESCQSVLMRERVHAFLGIPRMKWMGSQLPHPFLLHKLRGYFYPGWHPDDLSPEPLFWLGGAAFSDEDLKKAAVPVLKSWDRSFDRRRADRRLEAAHAMSRLASGLEFVVHRMHGVFFVFVPLDRLGALKALVARSAEENGLMVPVGAEIVMESRRSARSPGGSTQ